MKSIRSTLELFKTPQMKRKRSGIKTMILPMPDKTLPWDLSLTWVHIMQDLQMMWFITLLWEHPNLKGETLSYHWLFEGGNPTGSSDQAPGNVAYATPGHYTTELIVSGTSVGAVDNSYRHISIYDRPEAGTNVPILNWELQSLSGSRDQGGYTTDNKGSS